MKKSFPFCDSHLDKWLSKYYSSCTKEKATDFTVGRPLLPMNATEKRFYTGKVFYVGNQCVTILGHVKEIVVSLISWINI